MIATTLAATPAIGGPGIVMALVLAETAVGGVFVLLASKVEGKVRPAFFKLVGGVLAVCAILAWVSARAPLDAAAGGDATLSFLGTFAGITVAWQILLWAGARTIGRWLGIAALPVGVASLLALALEPTAANATPVAVFQLLAGALLVGGSVIGLLLGHWHLVDRKLGREPIARVNLLYLIGCGVAALAALVGGGGGGEARADLSPLLGVGVLTTSIAVGLAALCALIGFFNRALIKENSIQSATGLFYLGVMMAFAAEFAAKVRFF